MHLACERGKVDVVKVLLENGADVSDIQDNNILNKTMSLIKQDRLCKKIEAIGKILCDIYEMNPKDELAIMDIIYNMLKYTPDNIKELKTIKENFEELGKGYFK